MNQTPKSFYVGLEDKSVLDRMYLSKYLYLFDLLLKNKIPAQQFKSLFPTVRQKDGYWAAGFWDQAVQDTLTTVAEAVELYQVEPVEKNDTTAISLRSLRSRVRKANQKLQDWLQEFPFQISE